MYTNIQCSDTSSNSDPMFKEICDQTWHRISSSSSSRSSTPIKKTKNEDIRFKIHIISMELRRRRI